MVTIKQTTITISNKHVNIFIHPLYLIEFQFIVPIKFSLYKSGSNNVRINFERLNLESFELFNVLTARF